MKAVTTKRFLRLLALFFASSSMVIPSMGATWDGGNGDWNNLVNWNPDGVPNAVVAQIDNGGTANITANALFPITNLRVGYATGGTVGTLNIGADLTSTGASEIGRSGNGTLNITGGLAQWTGTTSTTLRFGVLAGGVGTGYQNGGTVSVAGTFSVGVQGSGFYTIVNGNLNALNNFTVAGSSGSGTLTQQGGTITVGSSTLNGFAYIGQGTAAGAVGTYNLNSGLFKATSLSVANGAGSTGTITQTGGTIDLLTAPGGAGSLTLGASGSAIYSIQNGALSAVNMNITNGIARIKSGSTVNLNGGLNMGSTAALEFTFDSSGVSQIDAAGASAIDSLSTVTVDGSAYAGGPGTFTLIDGLSFDNTPVINLSGFAAGTTYDWDTANGLFTVTIVPEPSVGMIVGVGLLGLLVRRQTQRAV